MLKIEVRKGVWKGKGNALKGNFGKMRLWRMRQMVSFWRRWVSKMHCVTPCVPMGSTVRAFNRRTGMAEEHGIA